LLTLPAAASINHLLRGESWARERLLPFAGRTAEFLVPPLRLAFTVTDSGEVTPAAAGASADATVLLTPALLLRALARDEAAAAQIETRGDAAFAGAIRFVATHLRWDFEEDLSGVVGDVAAHRIAAAARGFARGQAQAFDSLGRAATEYWTEEAPLLAKRAHVEQFLRDVDRLRDDVERLEQRLDRLGRRAAEPPR